MSKASVFISSAGWLMSFVQRLITDLQELGVSDEDIYALVKDGDFRQPSKEMAQAFVRYQRQAKKTFYLKPSTQTVSELVEAGFRRGGIGWSHELINDQNFPNISDDGKNRKLVFFKLDMDVPLNSLLSEAKSQGYSRPTHTDALKFWAQHVERGDSPDDLIFPHAPVNIDGAEVKICITRDGARGHFLDITSIGEKSVLNHGQGVSVCFVKI